MTRPFAAPSVAAFDVSVQIVGQAAFVELYIECAAKHGYLVSATFTCVGRLTEMARMCARMKCSEMQDKQQTRTKHALCQR